METNQKTISSQLLILLVLIGSGAYVFGQYLSSETRKEEQNRQISVTGEGEVNAQSNVATITIGVQTEPQKTSEAATNALAEKMNQVLDVLRQQGIQDKDFEESDLSVQPQYDYTNGKQELKGYQGQQNVRVKVSDTSKVGDIISKTTAVGANQIGNVQFDLEDDSDALAEAENKAINDAKEKANKLADALGVKLGNIKAYSSSVSGPGTPVPLYDRAALSAEKAVPDVPTTSQNIKQVVTITYEIR